jgi:hypothetical protein
VVHEAATISAVSVRLGAHRRAFNLRLGEHLTSTSTVGDDLGKRPSAQRFLAFCRHGRGHRSNPVASTLSALSRAFVDQRVPAIGGSAGGWVQRPENTSLFNPKVFSSAAPKHVWSHRPAHRRLRPRSTVQRRHTVGTEGPGRMWSERLRCQLERTTGQTEFGRSAADLLLGDRSRSAEARSPPGRVC